MGSVVNDTAAEITISGGTVTGQVANSGSGSISVTGGSFATAELEDFIDPDRTIILTLSSARRRRRAAMAATSGAAVGTPSPRRSGAATPSRAGTPPPTAALQSLPIPSSTQTQPCTPGGTEKSEDGEHLITVDRVTGGSLEVSAGRADEGETVTITAAPDDGYELKKPTVTDSQDGAVPVQNAGGGALYLRHARRRGDRVASFVRSGEQTELPFTDVDSGAYYYDAVRWAVEQGSPPCHRNGPSPQAADAHGSQLVTFLSGQNALLEAVRKRILHGWEPPTATIIRQFCGLWSGGITSGVTKNCLCPARKFRIQIRVFCLYFDMVRKFIVVLQQLLDGVILTALLHNIIQGNVLIEIL